MHLVLDTLTLHELELHISAADVQARMPEWITLVLTADSRGARIKGMAAFCGLDLIVYDTALDTEEHGAWFLQARSAQWLMRQPKAEAKIMPAAKRDPT